MMELTDDLGKKVFETISITLVCDECLKSDHPERCRHKLASMPRWLSSQRSKSSVSFSPKTRRCFSANSWHFGRRSEKASTAPPSRPSPSAPRRTSPTPSATPPRTRSTSSSPSTLRRRRERLKLPQSHRTPTAFSTMAGAPPSASEQLQHVKHDGPAPASLMNGVDGQHRFVVHHAGSRCKPSASPGPMERNSESPSRRSAGRTQPGHARPF